MLFERHGQSHLVTISLCACFKNPKQVHNPMPCGNKDIRWKTALQVERVAKPPQHENCLTGLTFDGAGTCNDALHPFSCY